MKDTYEDLVERLNILYEERRILNQEICNLELLKRSIDYDEQIKNETYDEYVNIMNNI